MVVPGVKQPATGEFHGSGKFQQSWLADIPSGDDSQWPYWCKMTADSQVLLCLTMMKTPSPSFFLLFLPLLFLFLLLLFLLIIVPSGCQGWVTYMCSCKKLEDILCPICRTSRPLGIVGNSLSYNRNQVQVHVDPLLRECRKRTYW